MKKWLSVFLCLCMVLGLVACGTGKGGEETTAAKESTFRVGYAKVNISPKTPMDLWGYAQMQGERVQNEILDYIYLTCVAITDKQDNTVLMFGADLGSMEEEVAGVIKTAVNKAVDVPVENIFINATHTHSAPDCAAISAELKTAAVEAAETAMADRKTAEMYFGTAKTSGVNFVRHYYDMEGGAVSVNHGNTAATEYAGHTTPVDEEMRVLQFKRDGGKDVVLANWQSHPHMTGGPQLYALSADIVGAMRMYMEQDVDCLFAYYQGGAGNIDPHSRIKTEEVNPERDYKVHGQNMANAAKMALQSMTKLETGEIKIMKDTYTCTSNKEDLDKVPEATMVVAYYKEGHTAMETKPYAESLGLYSYYHAYNLIHRGKKPDTFDISIGVVTIGDFAWSIMPGEFFDSTTKYIRDESPYTYNFAMAYTDGYYGYFPSQECWEYGSYEADTSPASPGDAENVANRLLEMLNQLHG